ncbi:hypothetical protein IFM89_014222 [Coptis chinensis]|uniref:Ribosomal RNA small subunit methyltransferase NEP1 n=1 Tax=Coptis chinensis TaxID=261450 RepID=A0A835LHW1_9MAGN|nr:hypothetical protein IFM89_014222 [Coptis chinensis]
MAGVLRTERQRFQPCSTKRMKQSEMRNDHECVRGAKLRKVDTEQSTITDEQEEMRVEKPLVVQSQGAHVLSPVHNSKKTRVTFILEKASLQKGVVGKTAKILNSDEHASFLLKQNKSLDDFRPDILYRALLAIFDSPLCKAGMVQAIYVKVDNGVLFEIKPHVHIPRTIKRFCGLMLELLQISHITASDNGEKLLRVIEQPVTRHLPGNSRIIGLSYSSEKLVNLYEYAPDVSDDVNLVFVVGAMTRGTIDKLYTDEFISGKY